MKRTNKYYLELKNRSFFIILIWISNIIITYSYRDFLLFIFINPLININKQPLYFIFTDIQEIFYVYLNIIFFISNQITIIFLIYHLIIFFSLGLYKIELKKFKFFLKNFFYIWLISFSLCYKILIPFSWNFFLNLQQTNTFKQPIELFFEAKLLDFIKYFITFYILCFFSFQFLMILIILLNNFIKQKKKKRKIFYLIFLIFSTIITPPEILSQILITFYLILIYEIIIFSILVKNF